MAAHLPPALDAVSRFPLLEALLGRRARRFALGSELPDGPLRFTSRHDPVPLDETERLLVLSACGGTTGWSFLITRHARYAPHLSNYSGSATGRTFPSAAGFHTSELFFTDDSGLYLFETRDAPGTPPASLEAWLEQQRPRMRRVDEKRLHLPAAEPYMEGHNTWCANRPGSLLVIPVVDLAQHALLSLCFLVQNGLSVIDDIAHGPFVGLEKFRHLVDPANGFPLTFFDQYMLSEASAELATSCYAGMLMLQAMGLGGWMYDGLNPHAVFGVMGDPDVPGLGFRATTDPRWSLPNPTGRPGVFEAFCPPRFPDMRAAVAALVQRKFGQGGPFHPDTPGAWKESRRVRSSAQVHDAEFQECVALIAQQIFDRYGRFPATVPSIHVLTYLQAQHIDLEFYDAHFGPGAYLPTHAEHMRRWHSSRSNR